MAHVFCFCFIFSAESWYNCKSQLCCLADQYSISSLWLEVWTCFMARSCLFNERSYCFCLELFLLLSRHCTYLFCKISGYIKNKQIKRLRVENSHLLVKRRKFYKLGLLTFWWRWEVFFSLYSFNQHSLWWNKDNMIYWKVCIHISLSLWVDNII